MRPARALAFALIPLLAVVRSTFALPEFPVAEEVDVRLERDGRISIQAAAASPRAVLERLATRLGFSLAGGDELSTRPRRWLFDRRPLAEIVAEVLRAEHVNYVILSLGTRGTVHSVVIGPRSIMPSI